MAVAIVIEKGAPGVPSFQARRGSRAHAGFDCHIRECAVTVISPESAITPIADEQVFMTVVVVIAGANALPPTGARNTSLRSDVGERPVAIVFVKVDSLAPGP